MIKKILIIGMMLLWSELAIAKSGLNIFAYPREAPQTPIYTPEGKAIKLGELKGKFLLVMFWSRHCAPCIRELDEINTFVNKTKDNGIEVLLVSKEDEWSLPTEQRELLKKYEAPDVRYYTDKEGKLAGDFGIFSSPHTVLVNQIGEEIGRISGTVDWEDDDVIEYVYKIKAEHGQKTNEQ